MSPSVTWVMNPVVSWETALGVLSEDPHAVLVDSRWYWDRPGRQAWETGHVPGAVFVDLTSDLTGTLTPEAGRHPLPTADAFADAMTRVGIDGRHRVVAYDDAGGVIAARLVWMLRVLDVDAAVISGGLSSYPHPDALSSCSHAPSLPDAAHEGDREPGAQGAAFEPRPWPSDRLVDTQDIAADLDDTGTCDPRRWVLIDARPPNRYRGQDPEIDPRLGVVPDADPRPGHIPGAINVPCRGHLTTDGHVKDSATVRSTFREALGPVIDTTTPGTGSSGTQIVSYCGSGVTACHNLLAMEHAGLPAGRLYPGSWSAWSRALHLPTSTGASSPEGVVDSPGLIDSQ